MPTPLETIPASRCAMPGQPPRPAPGPKPAGHRAAAPAELPAKIRDRLWRWAERRGPSLRPRIPPAPGGTPLPPPLHPPGALRKMQPIKTAADRNLRRAQLRVTQGRFAALEQAYPHAQQTLLLALRRGERAVFEVVKQALHARDAKDMQAADNTGGPGTPNAPNTSTASLRIDAAEIFLRAQGYDRSTHLDLLLQVDALPPNFDGQKTREFLQSVDQAVRGYQMTSPDLVLDAARILAMPFVLPTAKDALANMVDLFFRAAHEAEHVALLHATAEWTSSDLLHILQGLIQDLDPPAFAAWAQCVSALPWPDDPPLAQAYVAVNIALVPDLWRQRALHLLRRPGLLAQWAQACREPEQDRAWGALSLATERLAALFSAIGVVSSDGDSSEQDAHLAEVQVSQRAGTPTQKAAEQQGAARGRARKLHALRVLSTYIRCVCGPPDPTLAMVQALTDRAEPLSGQGVLGLLQASQGVRHHDAKEQRRRKHALFVALLQMPLPTPASFVRCWTDSFLGDHACATCGPVDAATFGRYTERMQQAIARVADGHERAAVGQQIDWLVQNMQCRHRAVTLVELFLAAPLAVRVRVLQQVLERGLDAAGDDKTHVEFVTQALLAAEKNLALLHRETGAPGRPLVPTLWPLHCDRGKQRACGPYAPTDDVETLRTATDGPPDAWPQGALAEALEQLWQQVRRWRARSAQSTSQLTQEDVQLIDDAHKTLRQWRHRPLPAHAVRATARVETACAWLAQDWGSAAGNFWQLPAHAAAQVRGILATLAQARGALHAE